MDLSHLSGVCLDRVLKMMDISTFSKTRQINKHMYEYVEKNRFRIMARCQDTPAILKILVHDPLEDFDTDKISLSFSVVRNPSYSRVLDILDVTRRFVGLSDPFQQLSAIHFDYIFLLYGRHIEMTVEEHEEIIDILRPFKLSTDWFVIHPHGYNLKSYGKVLKQVKFKNIGFHSPFSAEEISSWPIRHCSEVRLVNLRIDPIHIFPIINSFERASLVFDEEIYNEISVIREYLETIKCDRKVRGEMKVIYFELCPHEYLTEAMVIWKVNNKTSITSISKLRIDGGFAYIYFNRGYVVCFRDDENDKEMISSFLRRKQKITIDSVQNAELKCEWNSVVFAWLLMFSVAAFVLEICYLRFLHFHDEL